jgi:hypothetical protein
VSFVPVAPRAAASFTDGGVPGGGLMVAFRLEDVASPLRNGRPVGDGDRSESPSSFPPRQREGRPHPHRPGRHHHGQPAILTSRNTDRQSPIRHRRPVEPAVARHDTPALSMPETGNYPPSPNPGNRHWHPNA